MEFNIVGGTKIAEFIASTRSVDILEGPLGSGKTKACCVRIMRHAQEQVPSPRDGLRYTRFAAVRNTYPDLRRTTVRTWLECFPEHIYGRFNWAQPLCHRIRFPWAGGDVRTEVDFLALDKAEDVRKLRSGEYTGIFWNELPFIEKQLFDEGDSRLRYPPPEHGGPNPWRGQIADGNAPDEDHWLALMTGQVDFPPGMTEEERREYDWPPQWGFYMQPPAVLERLDERGALIGYDVNPAAENLHNLPADYYERMLRGKSKAWIDSRLRNVVTLVVEGSPVWTQFRRETHVAREMLRPVEGHDVIVSLDFGRMPAAVFMQAVNQRVLVQYELIGMNEGAVTFAPKVKRMLTEKYPNFSFRIYGDPKGQDKGQNDDRTAYQIFESHSLKVSAPPGLKMNEIKTRVSAVDNALIEMYDGTPRVRISPYCRTLIVGAAGRYFNEKDETGELKPCKNRYSHVCNAWEYGMIGIGEGRRMIGLTPLNNLQPVRVYKGPRTMRRVVA
jgi:hypothetical protein